VERVCLEIACNEFFCFLVKGLTGIFPDLVRANSQGRCSKARLSFRVVPINLLDSWILSWHKRIRRYLGIIEEDTEGVEGILLRKDGDVGRRGGSGEKVAVEFSKIKKWSEVLRREVRWRDCYDKE